MLNFNANAHDTYLGMHLYRYFDVKHLQGGYSEKQSKQTELCFEGVAHSWITSLITKRNIQLKHPRELFLFWENNHQDSHLTRLEQFSLEPSISVYCN